MDPNYLDLDPQERINKILALFSVLIGTASICAGLSRSSKSWFYRRNCCRNIWTKI